MSSNREDTQRGMIILQSHASTSGEQKKINHLQLVFFLNTEKIGIGGLQGGVKSCSILSLT